MDDDLYFDPNGIGAEGEEFYFLGNCDECGQELKIKCRIERIEVEK
jgi:hypothetical protein